MLVNRHTWQILRLVTNTQTQLYCISACMMTVAVTEIKKSHLFYIALINFSRQKVRRQHWTQVRLKVLWKIWMQMMRLVWCITYIYFYLTIVLPETPPNFFCQQPLIFKMTKWCPVVSLGFTPNDEVVW